MVSKMRDKTLNHICQRHIERKSEYDYGGTVNALGWMVVVWMIGLWHSENWPDRDWS